MSSVYLVNYFSLFVILLFSFFLSFIIFLLAFLLSFQTTNEEKNSIYECGFSPFSDARSKFEVKFYLISILFIVFDLEIIFLVPSLLMLQKLDLFGLGLLVSYLLIIWVGFIYEWKMGAMDF